MIFSITNDGSLLAWKWGVWDKPGKMASTVEKYDECREFLVPTPVTGTIADVCCCLNVPLVSSLKIVEH